GDLHLRVQAALLGEVADLLRRLGAGAQAVEDDDLAPIGGEDVVDHARGRRLAGAVGAEHAVDHAARDLERDVLDRDVVAEHLDDAAERERGGHAATGAAAPSRPSTARSSTAMRTATPQLTCWRITARGPSATCGASSTPRLIGPGCMTIASGLAKPSVRSLSPNMRDSSRVLGNR